MNSKSSLKLWKCSQEAERYEAFKIRAFSFSTAANPVSMLPISLCVVTQRETPTVTQTNLKCNCTASALPLVFPSGRKGELGCFWLSSGHTVTVWRVERHVRITAAGFCIRRWIWRAETEFGMCCPLLSTCRSDDGSKQENQLLCHTDGHLQGPKETGTISRVCADV